MEHKPLSHQLIRNVAWNVFGQFWMVVIGFFATPYIVRTLQVNLYGLYSLLAVIIGYFSFLQFGLGTAAVKYIAQYYAAREDENIRRTFWACLIVYSLMGALGTLAIAANSRFIAERILNIPAEMERVAVFVIAAGSLGFLVTMLMGAASSVLQAVGRFDILNRIGIILGTTQIGMTLLLLKTGFSLREIVAGNIVVQSAGVVFFFKYTFRSLPFLSRPVWDAACLRRLLRFGGFVTVSSVVAPVLLNIEKLLLTSLRPIASLTYYFVPFGLVDRLSLIRSSFSAVLFPAFSSLDHERARPLNHDLHLRSATYLMLLYGFFVLFFIMLGREFLDAWIGGNFGFNSTRVLAILALAGMVNALAVPSLNLLQGINKPHLPAIFHVLETVVYLPAAYLLIRHFAATGAALAWLLRVFIDTVLLNLAACRFLNENILAWYLKITGRCVFPLSVGAVSLLAVRHLGLPFFSAVNIAALFAAFSVYLFTVWRAGFDDFARMRLRQFAAERVWKK